MTPEALIANAVHDLIAELKAISIDSDLTATYTITYTIKLLSEALMYAFPKHNELPLTLEELTSLLKGESNG